MRTMTRACGAVWLVAALMAVACGGGPAEEAPATAAPASEPSADATPAAPMPAEAAAGLLNPNLAGEEEMAALPGMTTVRLKGPVMGWLLPVETPGWIGWLLYLVIMVPIYQLLLLGYGTLLGQFDFFWSKLKAIGRVIARRAESEPSA